MESTVLALAEMQNVAAVEEAVAHYEGLMEQRLRLPTESIPELLGIHAECEKEALQVFMARAFKDDEQHFQIELMKTMDDRKEEYCRRNEQESIKRCQALLATLSVELEEKVRSGVYSRPNGHQQFVEDLKDVEERYRREPKKGVMAEEALKQFLEGKEAVGRAILQSDTALSEKEKEMEETRCRQRLPRGSRRSSGRDRLSWSRRFPSRMAPPGEALMAHPLCLIENRPDGRLVLQEEALAILQRIRQPVVVVAIVGLYRTGKSYLMNRLAGQRKGFSLGSTVQANTKGIWMWCRPHPQRSDRTLVLLDTEGLGDTGKGNTQNDAWIFALAILLSSTLVYNSMGTIDQNALDQLHYVSELTQKIRVTSSSDPSQEDEDSSQFFRYFPAFIWAVRDFTLKLEIDGCPVSEDGYLEHALKLRKGDTEQIRRCNEPRLCIRKFFPSRKCFTFVWPTTLNNLQRLEELQEEDLEERFREAVARFCKHIWETSKCKTVPGGQTVTGAMLAKLAETYVETICSGKVPCLENAVLALAEMENTAAMEEAVAHYGRLMGERLSLPTESVPELLGVHAECEKEALQVFMARAFKDDESHFQAKLMKTLVDQKEGYCQRNEQESTQCCQALLASLSIELEEKVRSGVYFQPNGHRQFVDDLKDVEERYHQKPKKGVMAEAALKQFLEGKEAVGRAILQSDKALSEKEKQMEEARAQVEAAQREQEVQRQRQAELEQKVRDLQRSFEENVQQLMAKMEQDRKQLLEEMEKMMENRSAEQKALLNEGSQKEAEQIMKEIQRLREESTKIKNPSHLEIILEGLVTALRHILQEITVKDIKAFSKLFRSL